MNENAVKLAIIEYLTRTGWLVLRVNSGAIVGERKGKRRFFWFVKWFALGKKEQVAGVADILAFHPMRPPLAVETKAPGRETKTTEAQRDFLAEWAEHGGVWCVASSLDDLLLAL